MDITSCLVSLAVKPLIAAGTGVVNHLRDLATDPSLRLPQALSRAASNALVALEAAVTGPTIWQRIQNLTSDREREELRRQLTAYIEKNPLNTPGDPAWDRTRCRQEFALIRESKILKLTPDSVHQGLTRFSSPDVISAANEQLISELVAAFEKQGYRQVVLLFATPTAHSELPLFLLVYRYFFRREIERDEILARSIQHSQLETLSSGMTSRFIALDAALTKFSDRIEQILTELNQINEKNRPSPRKRNGSAC